MGRSGISSKDQRHALYNSDGTMGRLASGILITDGAGGVIVRQPHNIAGARILGTNIQVFFARPPRSPDNYEVFVSERSAVPHGLPEQYAYEPAVANFIIVSATDFSILVRTLSFRAGHL